MPAEGERSPPSFTVMDIARDQIRGRFVLYRGPSAQYVVRCCSVSRFPGGPRLKLFAAMPLSLQRVLGKLICGAQTKGSQYRDDLERRSETLGRNRLARPHNERERHRYVIE